VDIMAN